MADVARLDFSAPPPGAEVAPLPPHLRRTIETAGVWGPRALAAAWTKYKAEHDPPGMETREWTGPDKAWVWSVVAMPERRGLVGAQPAARAAAWAWYERRLSLSLHPMMRPIGTSPEGWAWRLILTWSDEDVSAAEIWCAEGGELPTPLRGRPDGRGWPVLAGALYYVADARDGALVGNCMSWWCPGGQGYTCELDRAGKFTGEEVAGMRDTDVPWPVDVIDAAAVRHCRRDTLRG